MVEVNEREKLEGLASYLGKAEEGLNEGDVGVVQGALREFYNKMPNFLEDSCLPDELQGRLIAISEFVHDTRDRLIHGVEVNKFSLDKTIKLNRIYERISFLQKTLSDYLSSWYSLDPDSDS